MKTALVSLLSLLTLSACALADPDSAPFVNHQLNALEKKVDADLVTGTLTKSDGDQLKHEISHVRSTEESVPSLTPATRRNLRQEVSRIQKDLELKENQAKALASASPSATP